MGDKFDTYEKQNMGQCAEKKYTQVENQNFIVIK